jgi:hypothetical protein
MRVRWLAVALMALLFSALPIRAEDKDKTAPMGEVVQLEIKGKVTTGVVAIGGETTGVVIATTPQGFTCELEGLTDASLNGKTAVVTGTLTIKPGVEVRTRTILKLASARAAEDKPEETYARVTKMVGIVQTGLMAPGGATTGVTISAPTAGVTWELDLTKDKDFRPLADKLKGKPIEIAGTIEIKPSTVPQRRPRTIVHVTSLKAVEK